MINPEEFYDKPLDEQAAILEKEAGLLTEAMKQVWISTQSQIAYQAFRQAFDFYLLAFQHKTFVQEELFSE